LTGLTALIHSGGTTTISLFQNAESRKVGILRFTEGLTTLIPGGVPTTQFPNAIAREKAIRHKHKEGLTALIPGGGTTTQFLNAAAREKACSHFLFGLAFTQTSLDSAKPNKKCR
jgi:hypothetical protein